MSARRRIHHLSPKTDVRAAFGPITTALAHPNAYRAAIIVGVLLTLPALFTGFALDDHLLRLTALGYPAFIEPRPAHDLFRFFDNSPASWDAVADRLGLWSLPPHFQYSLLRPLASLTHALDFALWPQQAWLMHAQSLLWYGLLIGLVGALYRNFIGSGWIAAAATMLFAIDDAHGTAAGWLSNRHALIAACLSCIALAVHDRCRRDGWKPGAWVGPIGFALALAASESALALLGYLIAYAVIFDSSDTAGRIRSILPYLAVVVAWEATRRMLGYGIDAWPGHPDLIADLPAAISALVAHLPVLALAQLGLPIVEFHSLLPRWAAALHVLFGVAALAATVYVLLPLLRTHRVARFFGAGALLSLVPLTLAPPSDRLLLLSGIGAMGLVAQFVAAIVQTARAGRLDSLRRRVLLLFSAWMVLHLILAPLLLPVRSLTPWLLQRASATAGATLPADTKVSEQQLVIVNAPDLLDSAFVLLGRAALGSGFPASARILAITDAPVSIQRDGADAVVVTAEIGLPRVPTAPAQRPPQAASRPSLAVGDRVTVGGFVADIEAIDALGPTKIRFRFDVPCDNESLRWVAWNGTEFEPFTVPEIGAKIVVGAAPALE